MQRFVEYLLTKIAKKKQQWRKINFSQQKDQKDQKDLSNQPRKKGPQEDCKFTINNCNGHNIFECYMSYMLRPFVHPFAWCCML